MTTYIGASVIMAIVIIAVVITNLRLKDRKRSREILGREPLSKDEGIAVAMEDAKRHRS